MCNISGTQVQAPGQPEAQAPAQTSGMKLGPGGRHARSAIQAGSLDSAPKVDVPLARLWPATGTGSLTLGAGKAAHRWQVHAAEALRFKLSQRGG